MAHYMTVKSMYKNAKTSVKVNGVVGRDCSGFDWWPFHPGARARFATTLYPSYGSAIPEV